MGGELGIIETVNPERGFLRQHIRKLAVGSVAAILAISGCANGSESEESLPHMERQEHVAETPGTYGSKTVVCPDSWVIIQTDNANNRLIADGVPSIREAENNDDARTAVNRWFKAVSADPELLAGVANSLNALAGRETDYKAGQMYDNSGQCISPSGVQATAEIEALLLNSSMTPDVAPENGYNTGTNANGDMVRSREAGISGDRTAIRVSMITSKNNNSNKVFYVMERCGNPVFLAPPTSILPIGPTENHPVVPPKHDDGRVPGPINERGEPDIAGEGPAGQQPDDDGYLPRETRPSVPGTTASTYPQTTSTTSRPPATAGTTPPSTNPPTPATTTISTTVPQSNPRPPKP